MFTKQNNRFMFIAGGSLYIIAALINSQQANDCMQIALSDEASFKIPDSRCWCKLASRFQIPDVDVAQSVNFIKFQTKDSQCVTPADSQPYNAPEALQWCRLASDLSVKHKTGALYLLWDWQVRCHLTCVYDRRNNIIEKKMFVIFFTFQNNLPMM